MLSARALLLGLFLSTASLLFPSSAFPESGLSLDPAAYTDFQLQTLSTLKTSELQNSRSFVAHQIVLLPPDQQLAVTSNLLSKLNSPDAGAKFNVAAILALYPTPWATANTNADAQALYSRMHSENDSTLKSILDSALANAKGLYRDGIRDYVLPKMDTQKSAEAKLRTMSVTYPDSQFAENASFYLALDIANQYILSDPHDSQLLINSNKAFEDYINRVQAGTLKKRDFLAAGFFFRGVNGWIQGRNDDAISWMSNGAKKFSDENTIYIYQIFLAPGDKTAVIDRNLPARSSFNAAIKVLSLNPSPQFPDFKALTKALQSL